MSDKANRQRALLRLVRTVPLSTQTELRTALKAEGFRVDQATVSRDIRELGLIKVRDSANGYRYGLVEELSPAIRTTSLSVLKRFIRSMTASGNLLVIKTDSGTAPTVAEALDRIGARDIIGTVAGDNTLFAVAREGVRGAGVLKRLKKELER